MTVQSLTLPVDIAWRRFAYSADMVDTNFGDLTFPPKWRSSMAVFYYVVPKEQTAELYPGSRIVYFRVTCSVTGWNPIEEIDNIEQIIRSEGEPDGLQTSIFEAFQAGEVSEYSPCLGAIAQISFHPHYTENADIDSYPVIIDFEPKKRELYESVTESGEFLSSSSDRANVQKGATNTASTEKTTKVKGSAGFSVGGFGVSASGSHGTRQSTEVETLDMITTDKSRERRETQSHSTTINQMYQLFNGYHLGTNRAVFMIMPRPHTVTNEGGNQDTDYAQLEFNLINGERKLEGIQDMFIVVQIPDGLKGICIQALLDTAHTINIWEFGNVGGRLERRQLVITRRIVKNCGQFDENGELVPTGYTQPPNNTGIVSMRPYRPDFIFEHPIDLALAKDLEPVRIEKDKIMTKQRRIHLANAFNVYQREVKSGIMNGRTSRRYQPKQFVESRTFKYLFESVLSNSQLPIAQLSKLGYVTKEESDALIKAGIKNVGDAFRTERLESKKLTLLLSSSRTKVTESFVKLAKSGTK